MMQDLIEEHINARKVVGEIVEANNKYAHGDLTSIEILIEKLSYLTKFYPEHILKEDKIFFPNTEKYFSAKESDDILSEFWEFDKKMIHEKYNKLYESLKLKYK